MTTMLSNFNDLADKYDVFLFDLWGVVHNGKKPFQNTLACLKGLKNLGKSVFLLSNSPRLVQPTANRLTQMGIPCDYYQGVHTSGTDCHNALRERPDAFYQSLGEKLFHIGPATYTPIFDTLDYVSVPTPDQADFVLISGTVDWVETLQEYDPLLNAALARNLLMVCANADKQAIHGNDLVLCSGLLAEMYAERGGSVRIHGKPNPIMYQRVHDLAQQQLGKTVNKDKILMIGDSLATDIKGANAYGIDSLMVLMGVHGAELLPYWNQQDTFATHLSVLTGIHQAIPTYVVAQL